MSFDWGSSGLKTLFYNPPSSRFSPASEAGRGACQPHLQVGKLRLRGLR